LHAISETRDNARFNFDFDTATSESIGYSARESHEGDFSRSPLLARFADERGFDFPVATPLCAVYLLLTHCRFIALERLQPSEAITHLHPAAPLPRRFLILVNALLYSRYFAPAFSQCWRRVSGRQRFT